MADVDKFDKLLHDMKDLAGDKTRLENDIQVFSEKMDMVFNDLQELLKQQWIINRADGRR